MILEKKFKLAWQKIKQATNILLIAHLSPDPDALASLGVFLELSKIYKIPTQAYTAGKLDNVYSFIPHEDKVSAVKPANLQAFDLIIILDCGALSRTGLTLEINSLLQYKVNTNSEQPFIIEFDHHEPQDNYADLEIRVPSKASTTELLFDFLKANDLPINRAIADCILIGLMSDTGNFLYNNASFKALAVSSKMLLKGASLNKIGSKIKGSGGFLALKIWGKALENIKFNPVTGLVSTALTEEDLSEFSDEIKKMPSDVFGEISSFMSYLPGAKVALFLREESGKIKASLRANGSDIDVARIARLFGGGGHKRAAGFAVLGKLQATSTGWRVIT